MCTAFTVTPFLVILHMRRSLTSPVACFGDAEAYTGTPSHSLMVFRKASRASLAAALSAALFGPVTPLCWSKPIAWAWAVLNSAIIFFIYSPRLIRPRRFLFFYSYSPSAGDELYCFSEDSIIDRARSFLSMSIWVRADSIVMAATALMV